MSSVTSKTMSSNLPPPTINSLAPSQRARLLRSTRKLENLLGTIPQVVEPDLGPFSATKNTTIREKSKSVYVSNLTPSPDMPSINVEGPEPSIVASCSSQNAVARKHSKRRSVPLPRPLLLHPNNVSAVNKPNVRIEHSESFGDSSQVLTLPAPAITTPSPLSPLSAVEDEPITPMDVPQEKIHRKRMAKLTRTLGENIPTEFILPHDHLRHQRSPSEPSARSLWPDWGKRENEAITNNVMSTTAPPPTINSLGPSQRARLLKSTRKLENLLGAIRKAEESASITKNSRHISMISFPVSSADPPDSLEPVSTSFRLSRNGPAERYHKHKSQHLPPPLVLRHSNVPVVTKPNVRIEQPSSADLAQVLTLPHTGIATPSPLSPLSATGDEPMTPQDVPQEKIRRKRMAKLTRTLGENIPTEFILPHDHLRHQRSPSEPSARSLWPDWGKRENEAITNNTMSTTVPPPTINSLDPSQRVRLLKSTRKLENLLGATPQVEESAPITKNSRHISMISFPVSSADPPDSLEPVPTSLRLSQNGPHSKHKSVHLPPPLVLRHSNVQDVTKPNVRIEQLPSADPAQVLTLPHTGHATPSPLSPLSVTGDEPMTPMDVPQEKIRRKRIAKLARTLGENIPTEFVLPHDRLKQHQRSPSEPSARSLWPDWGKRESEAVSVATDNAMSTALPPPTINSLDPSQRSRLLKSTRKLENLLGATPQVEESAMLPAGTENSRRVSFPVSCADSPDSEESLEPVPASLRLSQNGPAEKYSKRTSLHLPPPLVLRHNNVSTITKLNVRIEQLSSADSPQVLTLPHTAITAASPLSPLFTTEDEPMSPMEVPQEKIRRMRMAKLTRTLGENIPTEFILTHDHLKLSQHQRSPSEPSTRSLWPDWRKKEDEGTAALHLLSKGRPRAASVIDKDPAFTTSPSQRPKPAIIRRKLRPWPQNVGPEMILSSTLFTVTPSSPEQPSSLVDPSDSETTEDNDVDVLVGSDWRGEWNIKDAQERAMALRNLRGH